MMVVKEKDGVMVKFALTVTAMFIWAAALFSLGCIGYSWFVLKTLNPWLGLLFGAITLPFFPLGSGLWPFKEVSDTHKEKIAALNEISYEISKLGKLGNERSI